MESCRHKTQEVKHNSKRIEYIDVIRGFVMIVLVMDHVEGFCFNITADMPSLIFLLGVIMLPFFFFVSGFVGYKACEKLDFAAATNLIWNPQ